MRILTVDLYEHYGLERPQNAAGGTLQVFLHRYVLKEERSRRRPSILILPGGAYRFTSEREADPVAMRFFAKGYVPCVLHYSCAPCAFPVALREAALAMRYIREHAKELETDPHQAAALGFSAGGHLCGTLGMMYDAPELADLADPSAIRPDALCLCYPVSIAEGKTHEESFQNISGGDEVLRKRLDLPSLVRSDMPPVFLWHTRDDGAVPCRGSLLLGAALEAAGVDFSLHIHRHGRHGLSTADALVYPADDLPEVSPEIPGWPEAAMSFFSELGFGIRDEKNTTRT